MAILGFDTSTTVCTVAVSTSERVLVEHTVNMRRTHSESLMPIIAQVLQQAELTLQNCKGIAVVTGPGSFTGLRIGLATAKGLAFSADLPILAMTSLEVLAHNAVYTPLPVFSLLPAQRGEVYVGIFSCLEAYPVLEQEYFVGKVRDGLNGLVGDRDFIAVGQGAEAFKDDLLSTFGSQVKFLSPSHSRTRGALVTSLARAKLNRGEGVDLNSLEPFYMRLSSAERRRRQTQQLESESC